MQAANLLVSSLRLSVLISLGAGLLGQQTATAQFVALPGDYDLDGDVDRDDLNLWALDFGKQGVHFSDGNGDGAVDIEDLFLWKANEGAVIAALPAAASSVPAVVYDSYSGRLYLEPASLPIYAFKISTPAESVLEVTNSYLPGAGAWDVRHLFGNTVQGYDASMLMHSSPDYLLNASDKQWLEIATLETGLDASEFGSLILGLSDGNTLAPVFRVVPEPFSLILGMLAALVGGCRRGRPAVF